MSHRIDGQSTSVSFHWPRRVEPEAGATGTARRSWCRVIPVTIRALALLLVLSLAGPVAGEPDESTLKRQHVVTSECLDEMVCPDSVLEIAAGEGLLTCLAGGETDAELRLLEEIIKGTNP